MGSIPTIGTRTRGKRPSLSRKSDEVVGDCGGYFPRTQSRLAGCSGAAARGAFRRTRRRQRVEASDAQACEKLRRYHRSSRYAAPGGEV